MITVNWAVRISAVEPSAILGRITIEEGAEVNRVYQRGPNDNTDITVSGHANPSSEVHLRYTLWRRDQVLEYFDWTPSELQEAGKWEIYLKGLKTGGHYLLRLELVDRDGKQIDQRQSGPFFVGDLWLLGGQSNMDGCGPLDSEWLQSPIEGVSYFSLANTWRIAEEPLHYCYESVYPVYLTTYAPNSPAGRLPIEYRPRGTWPNWPAKDDVGAGLGLPFGKRILEKTGVPIGLVLCSLGGTTMDQWSPDLKHLGGDSLYGALIKRVKLVGGRIKGILWWQGESENDSTGYLAKMQNLIGSLRKDLKQSKLPFLLVQLGPQEVSGEASPLERVRIRELQRQLGEIMPNVVTVTAIDQNLSSSAHVDTQGYTRVGWRLANVALATSYQIKGLEIGPRVKRAWRDRHDNRAIHIKFAHVNGSLLPAEQIEGFSLRSKHAPEREAAIDRTSIHPEDPTRILIRSEAPIRDDLCLWYGFGWFPKVNLVDESDMACHAFGPLGIEY